MNETYPAPNGRFYVFCKARIIVWIVILLVITVCAYLTGCDPVKRHRILTFFFDGVPPLQSEMALLGDANSIIAGEGEIAKMKGSKHEPYDKCSNCHTTDPRTGRPIVKLPTPQLCYNCHSNYASSKAFVHGPVAVGACLTCHNPHYSRYESLLRGPQPYICYQCHEAESIQAASAHVDQDIDKCNRCHEPHVGTTRMFLKSF
jgi:predicted CXXCH cytochrome family protein